MSGIRSTIKVRTDISVAKNAIHKRSVADKIKKHWQLYVLLALPVIYLIVFKYFPMYGAQIAFRDFGVRKGITGSPWVGFKHFERFFKSYQFVRLIRNTLGISVYQLLAGFPLPIMLAISLNEVPNLGFKKTLQMVTYAPYFISTVVLVAMMLQVLSPHNGLVSTVLKSMGSDIKNIMGVPEYFKSLYVWSGVWQFTGYSSIIYLAALSGIDPSLHEAAIVDGATKIQRIRHIDFPGILPTAVILLILQTGRIMNVGFEKVYLMQNPLNMRTSDIIATYVYRVGIESAQYSFSTAVGLFNAAINVVLLLSVNKIANKITGSGLW
jgi:putative aldouronate transport system permease protein